MAIFLKEDIKIPSLAMWTLRDVQGNSYNFPKTSRFLRLLTCSVWAEKVFARMFLCPCWTTKENYVKRDVYKSPELSKKSSIYCQALGRMWPMWIAEIPEKHWVNVKRGKTQSQRETRENRVSENRGKTFNARDYNLSYDWLIVSFTGPAVIPFIRMNHRKTLIQREARTTIQRTWLFFELWLAHRFL